jgi:hypothetical protein
VAEALLKELTGGATLTRPQAGACGHPLPGAGEGLVNRSVQIRTRRIPSGSELRPSVA